jgi:hypothetical protein
MGFARSASARESSAFAAAFAGSTTRTCRTSVGGRQLVFHFDRKRGSAHLRAESQDCVNPRLHTAEARLDALRLRGEQAGAVAPRIFTARQYAQAERRKGDALA